MVGDRWHLGRGRLGNAVRSQFSRPRLGDWSVRLLSNVEAALVGAMGVGCDDEMRKKKKFGVFLDLGNWRDLKLVETGSCGGCCISCILGNLSMFVKKKGEMIVK